MTRLRRPAGDRLTLAVERAGAALGIAVVVLFVAFGIVFRYRGLAMDGAPRPPVEQHAMLASGDCAVAPNHALVGKLIAPLAASRGRPKGGYELEAIDRRQVFQVGAADVSIVPCSTIPR